MTSLQWNDTQIPHKISLKAKGSQSCIIMTIIKDVTPEELMLTIDTEVEHLLQAWRGEASPISDAFDDGNLYSQVRCLFNLEQGCVIWTVNHITLPTGEKMSADKLAYIPHMISRRGRLDTLGFVA